MADPGDIFGSGAESDEESHGSPASGNESPGSHHSETPVGSPVGSGSPAHSGSPPNSPGAESGSPASHHSGSPNRSQSGTPMGSPASHGSGSPARSRSGSPARSGSGSPAARSGSQSPARSGSGSPRSRSGSPARSGSGSPARSGSGSPARSGSGSPARSRSGSPRSGSGSPARSRSGSPARSRTGSPRSRSGSPARSGSGSPTRSGSGSPARSRSGSPAKSRSRSRSQSGSPARGSGSDSGSDIGKKRKKKRKEGSGSDSDDNVNATVGDLFGDADDISSDEEVRGKRSDAEGDEGGGSDRERQGPVIEDDDEEQPEEEVPETRIEVEIPRIMTNLGKILHYVKLPNFLSVETRPYDNQTYEDEIDEDEVLDEEGRARLKLKVENTIRWRKKLNDDGTEATDEMGVPVRESNARVVRWSDGSMSLHLGDEIFDVHTMPIQGDFNHLFVRQGTGLQGQSIFKTKLAFRPHSTESFTHRKMTLSLADRSTKAQKVKVLPISGRDPDAHRSEMIKKEEEKLRASIRRESTRRRMKERSLHRGLNARYLEDGEDDDEGGVSLNDLKKEYKQKRADRFQTIYSSDSDESYSDGEKSGRLMKAKKGGSDEDSEEEKGPKKKKARIVESDSEEEGGEASQDGGGDHSEGSNKGSDMEDD